MSLQYMALGFEPTTSWTWDPITGNENPLNSISLSLSRLISLQLNNKLFLRQVFSLTLSRAAQSIISHRKHHMLHPPFDNFLMKKKVLKQKREELLKNFFPIHSSLPRGPFKHPIPTLRFCIEYKRGLRTQCGFQKMVSLVKGAA